VTDLDHWSDIGSTYLARTQRFVSAISIKAELIVLPNFQSLRIKCHFQRLGQAVWAGLAGTGPAIGRGSSVQWLPRGMQGWAKSEITAVQRAILSEKYPGV
jgi:hypothetical protein